MNAATVGDVVGALAQAFPPEHAEEWDRVGLLAGDATAVVTGVVVSLDADVESVLIASDAGANLLVTHHPAYLAAPFPVRNAAGGGSTVFHALAAGVSLVNAHTNLDRDPAAQRLLPARLGLTPVRALERSVELLAVVTVYAPPAAVDEIVSAMTDAGAGRLGEYDGCAFESPGHGRFRPSAHARPHSGVPGEPTRVEEVRIEMVSAPHRAQQVVSAAVAAHPYEEPLVTVTQASRPRRSVALGMLAKIPDGTRLADLASRAAVAFGVRPRVWGEPDRPVRLGACATGSAGSLVSDAVTSGADVLIAGEVRYHDATDAGARGLSVIELGHDVSEWPLVGLLANVVRSVPGLDPASVIELPPSAGWWTPQEENA